MRNVRNTHGIIQETQETPDTQSVVLRRKEGKRVGLLVGLDLVLSVNTRILP